MTRDPKEPIYNCGYAAFAFALLSDHLELDTPSCEELVEKAIARNLPDLEQLPSTEADLDVGTSDKELVYTEDTARLYHYDAMCDEIYRVPVLIVMSPVTLSRPSMNTPSVGMSISSPVCVSCRRAAFTFPSSPA